jgi:hypothetical protein
MPAFTPDEMIKVQDYMRRTFGNEMIGVKPRAQASGSIEILLKGEFLGLCYKNEEDGETSFDFTMSILDIDLEG